VEHEEFVQDPETDIARNEYLDEIKVGILGRARFQKIYVRSLNGKRSTTKYTPEEDAPSPEQALSILPTTEEKEGRPDTMQFLVVGLVLAAEPLKYSTKGTGKARVKDRKNARRARGILNAEANVLRAIVPITEYISNASIKYYVACHPVMNLCSMRLITSDAIFFFPKIWTDILTDAEVKLRRTAIGSACKHYAAKIKNLPESIANIPSTEGTLAFYDFESVLEKSDAEKFIKEVKVYVFQYCINFK